MRLTRVESTAFFSFNAWIPILTFPQVEAPEFPHGFRFCLACTIISIAGLSEFIA
jgi:hypothetical protein